MSPMRAMGDQTPRRATRSARIRDWLLYVAIAVLIFVALGMFAIHQVRTGGSTHLPLKWLGFAGMTAIVFGYAIQDGLQPRARQRFWVLLGVFFAVHCAVGAFILLRVSVVPLLLYAVLTPVECAVLAACIGFFLGPDE